MNRYWQEVAQLSSDHSTEYSFSSVIKHPGLYGKASKRLVRAWIKKVVYPAQVKMSVRSGIAHVLDHSYAHMLAYVPRRVAKVVTLHDLIPLRESEGLSPASLAGFRKRVEFLREADMIVAVSEHSKREAVELLGIDPLRIHVSPNGVRRYNKKEPNTPPYMGSEPYILSVGSTLRRKRLDLLPEILRETRLTIPDMKLVRVGNSLPTSLVSDIQKFGGEAVLEQRGIVNDLELDALYRNAHALILTSSHEGFGLPVLEAMARGCPVVCTNTTSLPEVGGDAVLYFDIDQPSEAAAQIIRLAEDPSLRESIISAGLSRSGVFTWERHFNGLLEAYDLALSGR
jgi:glycosyltransferase involved in cell wall biosynthesis